MLKKLFKKYYGYVVVASVGVLPLLLWVGLRTGESLLASPITVLGAIGKAAAISGMALYCLMPVLSMRHKAIVRFFGGLDIGYRLHRKVGKIVFYLLWAHPVLLGASRLLGGKGLLEIWGWTSRFVLFGIVSLVVFTAIMSITIYAHIKHQKWITLHRYFGWILPLIFLHAIGAQSQIVKIRPLYWYMVTMCGIGVAAFLYRSVFGRFVNHYRYQVDEVNKVSPSVTELVLKPIGIPIVYNPGQYAFLSIKDPKVSREAHPFSFTTAANGPYVRFVIKDLGDDTAAIRNVVKGDKAFIEGPYGHFSYHNSPNLNQVWIAGGVGVTPFLSLARSLTPSSKYKIHLFYAAEKLEDAVFLRELLLIERTIPEVFTLTIVNKNISGFVTIDLIIKEVMDVQIPDYLICGPPPMLKKLKADLLAHKVSPERIITEEFSM